MKNKKRNSKNETEESKKVSNDQLGENANKEFEEKYRGNGKRG